MRTTAAYGDGAGALRRGVLALAAVGALGTWLELAVARHWKSPVQLIPWISVLAVVIAVALVAASPTSGRILVARALAAVSALTGMFGVVKHVQSNYESGPLDAVYGQNWQTMGVLSRLWHATIESVGASPSFAPGALALLAACVLVATIGHPAARHSGTRQ